MSTDRDIYGERLYNAQTVTPNHANAHVYTVERRLTGIDNHNAMVHRAKRLHNEIHDVPVTDLVGRKIDDPDDTEEIDVVVVEQG